MTAPRLTDDQLGLLCTLGNPSLLMVAPDRRSRALAAKGYVASRSDEGLHGITPAGLRRLAEELESGGIAALVERLKAKRKAA
jgi:hypothetical protein